MKIDSHHHLWAINDTDYLWMGEEHEVIRRDFLASELHAVLDESGIDGTVAVQARPPAVILHELAHAYHDQVLGFEEPSIVSAYDDAMKRGIQEKSLLYPGDTVKHYATTNHKEYFAEATEAYFYHNDFYPFVRAELRQHDPAMFGIMEKVWGKTD